MKEKKKNKDKSYENKCGGDSCELDFIKDTIDTDPLGMYTGVPANPSDMPVQDADDL